MKSHEIRLLSSRNGVGDKSWQGGTPWKEGYYNGYNVMLAPTDMKTKSGEMEEGLFTYLGQE